MNVFSVSHSRTGDEASLGMNWETGDFLVIDIGEVSIKTVLWDFKFVVFAPGVLGDDCDGLKNAQEASAISGHTPAHL